MDTEETGLVCTGLQFIDSNLYMCTGNQVWKFESGVESWCVEGHGWDLGVDASGNAYTGRPALWSGVMYRLDNDDGTATELTRMGHQIPPGGWGGVYQYTTMEDVHVDDTLGIVCWGGKQNSIKSAIYDANNFLYNLAVRTFDDTAGDQVIVGDLYESGGNVYTHEIMTDYITSDGNSLFAMITPGGGVVNLYKYSWDGTSLTEETSATSIAATSGVGFYVDLWGNLVVVNNRSGVATDFYFYDTNDLAYLGKVEDFPAGITTSWGGVGASYLQGKGIAQGTLEVSGVASTPSTQAWTIGDCNLLENREVCLFADAIPRGTFDYVDALVEDWNDTYSVIIVGINYYSIYESLPLVAIAADSTTQGRNTTIKSVLIDFYRTLGAHAGVDMTYSADLLFSDDEWATAMLPFSGIKGPIPYVRGTSRDPVMYLWEWDPVPMCVRGIYVDKEVTLE
jgi:hypothetical protein